MKTSAFSLRTLLVASTLAAIGFALVGNRMLENRRQERLVDEALKATNAEGSNEISFGYEDRTVQVVLVGEYLSETSARRLVEATRIKWIHIWGVQDVSPELHAILEEQFILYEPFPGSSWHRKGSQPHRANPKPQAWTLFRGKLEKVQVNQGSSP